MYYLFEMETKVKIEPEEVQLSTSGGGEQEQVIKKQVEREESFHSDEIDEKFLDEYCEEVKHIQPMTISKKLFYTDKMVAKNYARLSKADKERFDQMKKIDQSDKTRDGGLQLD